MRSTSSRNFSDFLDERLLVRKVLEVDKVLDAATPRHKKADRESVLCSEVSESAACARDHDGIAGLGVCLRMGKDAGQERRSDGWRKSDLPL